MTSSAPPRAATGITPPRLLVVDALRCLAVLLVLGRHIAPPIADPTGTLAAPFAVWRACGWIGVDLFFVLSGFLVSGLLFAEHQRHGCIRAWHFLARRGFKIYPAFYALLLVSLVWLGARLPAEAFLWEAMFLQNYLDPVVWNHTWSLAVEEHFYILLAAALAFAVRRGRGPDALRGLPTITATVCVVVLALRIVAWLQRPPGHAGHLLFPTHLRIDALAFGTGLAYAWHHHRASLLAWIARRRQLLATAAGLLLLPSMTLRVEDSAIVNTIGLTANYLAFGALLLLALTSERANGRRTVRMAASLGVYSYSIYLWHMPVAKAVRWWVEPQVGHGLAVAIYVTGSMLLGIVMAKLIELPFLRLRERWLPKHQPVTHVAAPRQPAGTASGLENAAPTGTAIDDLPGLTMNANGVGARQGAKAPAGSGTP